MGNQASILQLSPLIVRTQSTLIKLNAFQNIIHMQLCASENRLLKKYRERGRQNYHALDISYMLATLLAPLQNLLHLTVMASLQSG